VNRSALLMLVLLLAGCNVHSKNAENGGDSVKIDADQNGSVSFNLPLIKGQVQIPASIMHNGNFDIDGVKLMPGSAVTGFNMNGGDHGATVNASFTAPAAPDQVRSYFLSQFKEHGMEVALAGGAVTGKTREGDAFTIQITPAATGSQGRIVVQSKD
jgi:hypothetical protein